MPLREQRASGRSDTEPVADRFERHSLVVRFCEELMTGEGSSLHLVDGEWGSGKSVFLQMCAAELRRREHPTPRVLEFDACQQSYTKNPLLDLTYHVTETLNRARGRRLRRHAELAARHIALTLDGMVASRTYGLVSLKAVLGRRGNEWEQAKDRLESFQRQLGSLTDDGPLVLLVDEVDRCEPEYAVKLLEQAHLMFDVPGVYVVLGVSRQALEHAIRRARGQHYEATSYLQSIVGQSLQLPHAAARHVVGMINDGLEAAGWAKRIEPGSLRQICEIWALVPFCTYGSYRNVATATDLGTQLLHVAGASTGTTGYSGRLTADKLAVFGSALVALRLISPDTYRHILRHPTDGVGACALLHGSLEDRFDARYTDADAMRCLRTLCTYLAALGGTAEDDQGPVVENAGLGSSFGADELAEMRTSIARLRTAHFGAPDYGALPRPEIELPLRNWGALVNTVLPLR